MSKTALCIRPKTNVSTLNSQWQKLFPMNPTTSAVCSVDFMKKFITVSISCIVSWKKSFPEDSFEHFPIEDLNMDILKKHSKSQTANNLYNLIISLHDAIEKQYLRQLIFSFYIENLSPENTLESYIFDLKHGKEINLLHNSTMENNSFSGCNQQKIWKFFTFLKKVVEMSTVPKNSKISITLFYHNNVPPRNYNLRGFTTSFDIPIPKENLVLIDDISTPYHKLQLCTYKKEKWFTVSEPSSESITKSINAPKSPQTTNVQHDTSPKNVEEPLKEQEKTDPTVMAIENNESRKGSQGDLDTPNIESLHINEDLQKCTEIKCPCGKNFLKKGLLLCSICSHYQHGICFGILKSEDYSKTHVCDTCSAQNHQLCTDIQLMNLNSQEKKDLCIIRHALALCLKLQNINTFELMKHLYISKNEAHKVISLFEELWVFKPQSRNSICESYVVDMNNIENVIEQYFVEKITITPTKFPKSLMQTLNEKTSNLLNICQQRRIICDENEVDDPKMDMIHKATLSRKSNSLISSPSGPTFLYSLINSPRSSIASRSSVNRSLRFPNSANYSDTASVGSMNFPSFVLKKPQKNVDDDHLSVSYSNSYANKELSKNDDNEDQFSNSSGRSMTALRSKIHELFGSMSTQDSSIKDQSSEIINNVFSGGKKRKRKSAFETSKKTKK